MTTHPRAPDRLPTARPRRITARSDCQPDYRDWRAQVEATGGCAAPIHLRGSSRVLDRDGAVLLERTGTVLAPCGNRRADRLPGLLGPLRRRRLPPAARRTRRRRHQERARHASPTTRGSSSPSPRPRSGRCTPAPSPRAGTSSPAAAASATTPTTPASAPPLDPRQLRLRRAPCSGRPTPARCGHASPSPCAAPSPPRSGSPGASSATRPAVLRQGRRVPAARARALPRRHPPRRPRRTHRPATRPGSTSTALRAAITAAAQRRALTAHRPDGTPLRLGLGCAAGPARGHPDRPRTDRGRRRGRSPTPPWPATSPSTPPRAPAPPTGADRPIRDVAHVEHLRISDHHRRMITTAWELGGLPRLRRAEPAALGAHARLPRPLPHQVPPLLHHLHRAARRAGPGACSPTWPSSTATPTTPTTSARSTWTPSP